MYRLLYIFIPCLLLLCSFKGATPFPEKKLIVPRQGKKDQKKIFMEEGKTYFLELIHAHSGQLDVKLAGKNQFPFKTIIARFDNHPIRGASFTIKNPFSQGLSFNFFQNTYLEGYTKLRLPVIHGTYTYYWGAGHDSVFGIVLSDFTLVE